MAGQKWDFPEFSGNGLLQMECEDVVASGLQIVQHTVYIIAKSVRDLIPDAFPD